MSITLSQYIADKFVPSFSTRIMMVHEDKTLSCDASQLTHNGCPMFGQIDGSGLPSLILVSHKTGQLVRMVVSATKRDAEGDITHWLLRSDRRDEHRLNLPYTLQLTVWNT